MKALIVVPSGSAGKLELREVPSPQPRPNELLIDIHASTVSRADTFVLRDPSRVVRSPRSFQPDEVLEEDVPGPFSELRIGGGEFAGTVVELGANTRGYHIGDRVMGMCLGGQREQLAIDYRLVLPVPDALDWVSAAAVPSCFITSHDALVSAAEVKPGETMLVHSAASGVGTVSIQLAKAFGATTVFGTAGSAEKLTRLSSVGLDVPINYKTEDFAKIVSERTHGRGVDIILDLVGGPHLRGNIDALAIKGRMISIGKTGGAIGELNLDTVSFKRVRIIGVTFRSRTFGERADAIARAREGVWKMLAEGRVRPIVDRVYPLVDAAHAYAYMETNANFGRVVIRTRPESE